MTAWSHRITVGPDHSITIYRGQLHSRGFAIGKTMELYLDVGSGGIPHYVAAALLFVGASRKYLILLVSGGIVLLVVWTLGYLFNSHVQRLKRWAH
ncbi:hypothetical protein [Alicyclobacillus fastidiosus]|uniref:hypothetical protein n=1 Tax=Alicyclobacillus fastidiosus TaxID=392011 RepID=UPI0024E1442C|nr:hypothetical protein [Alicyclobacillus fastidiosus]